MNAKQATFSILNREKQGAEFTGVDLATAVREHTGEMHYPATTLRYLREWRDLPYTRTIECINKRKSLYRVW